MTFTKKTSKKAAWKLAAKLYRDDCQYLSMRLALQELQQQRQDAVLSQKNKELARLNNIVSLHVNTTLWFTCGRVGISSKAMLSAALGLPVLDYSTPLDLDDLNRCLLMLSMVPEIRARLASVAELSPKWGLFIQHWDELESLFLSEVGLDWSHGDSAPKTYALMRNLNATRLSTWTKNMPNSMKTPNMTKFAQLFPTAGHIKIDDGNFGFAPLRTEPFAPVISPLHTVTKAVLDKQALENVCHQQEAIISDLRARLQAQAAGNAAMRQTINAQTQMIADQFDVIADFKAYIDELEGKSGESAHTKNNK